MPLFRDINRGAQLNGLLTTLPLYSRIQVLRYDNIKTAT